MNDLVSNWLSSNNTALLPLARAMEFTAGRTVHFMMYARTLSA